MLIGVDGRPRVADFGLARSDRSEPTAQPVVATAQPEAATHTDLLRSPLTLAGTVMGTPAYMSPEQHEGEAADPRSDQFSFCAALYEALYKTLPYPGDTLHALTFNVLAGKLRPQPRASGVPRRIYTTLRKGLARAPRDRFPSMAELLHELTFDPTSDPSGAPWARRLFIGGFLAVVAANTTYLQIARVRGTLQVRDLQLGALVLLFGTALVGFLLRRSLWRNAFHRGMVTMVAVCFAQMAFIRWAGGYFGLSLTQTMAMDMGGMTATATVIAALFLPAAWPFVALSAVATAMQVIYPHTQLPLLIYPVMAVALGVFWNRAAMQARVRECRSTRWLMQSLRQTSDSSTGTTDTRPIVPECIAP